MFPEGITVSGIATFLAIPSSQAQGNNRVFR